MMRKCRIKSFKNELICKSREAMLSAVQIFNNPLIQFKSEIFIVLIVISWTYLLHAYYKKNKIDYRYTDEKLSTGNRKRYKKTPKGKYRYWELAKCLSYEECPLEKGTRENLRFLLDIRNEIEHIMTTRIDNKISDKFQACCINYNRCIKEIFGKKYGIDKYLSFSLQFSTISKDQEDMLLSLNDLPENIEAVISDYDKIKYDQCFSYKVYFQRVLVNHDKQANEVINFLKPTDTNNDKIKNYVIKEREKKKYTPKMIVNKMKEEGYKNFSIYKHTKLWKEKQAKGNKKYGVFLYGYEDKKNWVWYESWVDVVREWCKSNEIEIKE